MSSVFPYISFALRRISEENGRWAKTLRASSESLREATDRVRDVCAEAIARIERAQDEHVQTSVERKLEHQHVMAVLNRQDIDEMIAERDRLVAELSAKRTPDAAE